MAIFHLAKSTKGDRSAALRRLKRWIDKGVLNSDLTVLGAKKLVESTKESKTSRANKSGTKGGDKRKFIAALERNALALDVAVNSLPLARPDKTAFHKGLAVALLSSQVDEESGTEVVKILTVVNDEVSLQRLVDGLEDVVP
jgi:hypothetical protein